MSMEKQFSMEDMGNQAIRLHFEHQEDLDCYLGWFRENEPAAYRRFYEIWADDDGMLRNAN